VLLGVSRSAGPHLCELLRLDLRVVTSFFAASSSLSLTLMVFCRLHSSSTCQVDSGPATVSVLQATAEQTPTLLSRTQGRPLRLLLP
jgi:hypothetical protein